MEEVFPVLAGIVLGLATCQMTWGPARGVVLAVFSLALGALASWLAGELAVSRLYVLVDAGQVALAAVLTGLAVAAWRRRALRPRT